jgi:hypothetical protein
VIIVTSCRPLLDNDIAIILAVTGMLDPFLQALKTTVDETRILPSLIPMLKKSKSIGMRYSDLQLGAAENTLEAITVLNSQGNRATFAALTAVEQMGPGEAALICEACEDPQAVLVTGDRRCVVALGVERSIASIRAQMVGRVCPLEIVLSALLRQVGIGRLRATNRTIGVIFSSGVKTTEVNAKEGIDSYRLSIENDVGADLLIDIPG